jgi:hypothetical protein
MALWATLDQVLTHLGLSTDTPDGRVQTALDVSDAWAKHKRPDLITAAAYTEEITYEGVDNFADSVTPDVNHAVVIYAGLLFRERSTPQGIAGYEDQGGGYTDTSAYYRALDLLGTRKPVAR